MKTNKALRFNNNKEKWSLVHMESIKGLPRVLMYGLHKYTLYEDSEGNRMYGSEFPITDIEQYNVIESGRDNWKKEMILEEILDSAQRHLASLIDGEEFDEESGLPHADHIITNMMFYNYHKKLTKEE